MQNIDSRLIHPEKKIRFSHNWNGKLYNRFFTTIRLESEYHKPGEYFQIWTKEKDVFTGKTSDCYAFKGLLHEKKSIRIDQLPSITATLDTGYSLAETKALLYKMYPGTDWEKQLISILLIENIQWQL